MKVVTIDRPVKDVDGLLVALRAEKPSMAVISVSTDERHTYVYLTDRETRNPRDKVLAWKDRAELRISFEGPTEILADGKSKAHIILTHCDPHTGVPIKAKVKVDISSRRRLAVSQRRVSMKDGNVRITIGPSDVIGDDVVEVVDPWNRFKPAQARFSFVEVPPDPPPPPPPVVASSSSTAPIKRLSAKQKAAAAENEKRPSVWSVFKRLWKKG